MSGLLNSLIAPSYASAAMRAVMSDEARLQRMLDFEAALARAEAAVGIISASGAVEIADACRAERYDLGSLVDAAALSDPASAMVEALKAEVGRHNQTAAGFVHWGASSQDVIDTALTLELRAAIDVLLTGLDRAIKGFTSLAGRHRRALLPARAQMQHALPMPFALKLAGYAAALGRSRERLARLRREALLLQFGGTAGTLASYAEDGPAVADRLGALLDLPVADGPWYSHRDRLAEVGASLAIVAGTCGKIARDIALLMQIEVGEAAEPVLAGTPPGPARNRRPVGAGAAVSAAAIAPGLAASLMAAQSQDHERGLAGGQTEWTTFPMLALVTSGAVEAVARIAEGLEFDIDRMRANLELSEGQIMSEAVVVALADKIGRAEAQELVGELAIRADQERRPLREVVLADPRVKAELTPVEIEKLFVPLTYQGSAQLFIDRLVFQAQSKGGRRLDFRPPEPRPPVASSAAAPQPLVDPAAAAPSQLETAGPPAAEPATQDRADSILAPSPPLNPEQPAPPQMPKGGLNVPALEPELPPSDEAAPPVAAEAAAFDQHEANEPLETSDEASDPDSAPDTDPDEGLEAASSASPAPRSLADDAPGAFMDILSRAEAEAQAQAEAEARKRWRDRS